VNTSATGAYERVIDWSGRAFRILIWAISIYGLGVAVITLYDWIQHPLALSPYAAFQGHPAFRAFAVFVGGPLIALLGFLILRQQRDNLVGVLLIAWAGGFVAFGISADIQPALFYIVSLPINAWWGCFIMLPYFFPDGRGYPRWLTPFILASIALSVFSGLTMVLSTPGDGSPSSPPNPFYTPGSEAIHGAVQTLNGFFLLLFPVVLVSPILRYRRADFVQRQQIKAFTWTTAVILIPYVIVYLWAVATYNTAENAPPLLAMVLGAAIGLIGLVPPIAIGYAILRHKLFDIDVVIRRTLIYTAVTVLLGVTFYGLVLVMQRLITTVTGQESPVALVASTLIIAALFSPLRRRVQEFIDRRFYRRKYDAQRVLAEFATVARNETDVDRLSMALEGAVVETMQPSGISSWVAQR
jgi:hypothetical protein